MLTVIDLSESTSGTVTLAERPYFIRLAEGTNLQNGLVQVSSDGSTWGTVCSTGLATQTASVFCRALGFPTSSPSISTRTGSGVIRLANVQCTAGNNHPYYCTNGRLGGSIPTACTHAQDLYLDCSGSGPGPVPTASQTPRTIRLSNVQSGLLEIYNNGVWGTVCDNGFNVLAAQVACRQLGIPFSGARIISTTAQGDPNGPAPGTGAILLDQISCSGTENSLLDCQHSPIGTHSCTHSEDVAIFCAEAVSGAPVPTQSASLSAVQLLNPFGAPSYGYVKVSSRGTDAVICGNRFSPSPALARVICRELGLPTAAARIYTGPLLPSLIPDSFSRLITSVTCTGSETSLADCSAQFATTTSCTANQTLAVMCTSDTSYAYNTTTSTTLPQGSVRLVDGVNPSSGRLEVLYNNVWGSVCAVGFSAPSATVACAQLGLPTGAVVTGYFGSAKSSRIWIENIRCSGSESSLLQCNFGAGSGQNWGSSGCESFATVGVYCQSAFTLNMPSPTPAAECNPPCGTTRLAASTTVDGGVRGRLEFNWQGVWGTVCDDGFDDVDARVACRELGLPFVGAKFVSAASVVTGGPINASIPVWLSDMRCSGSEPSLFSCPYLGYGNNGCEHSEDVGLICTNALTTSLGLPRITPSATTLRLVGGTTALEGRLEILINGEWGTVCQDGWDDLANARVACRQLGLPWTEALPVYSGRFGPGTGPIWLDDVSCTGNEADVIFCSHRDVGSHDCQHTSDIGLSCAGRNTTAVPTSAGGPVTSLPCAPAAYPSAASTAGAALADSVRLVGCMESNKGRVEIFHDNEWRPVCDDGNFEAPLFGVNEARVICRELGLPSTSARSYIGNVYPGPVVQTYWLDDVNCTGSEPTLADCMHRPWGEHNCNPSEVVGVECLGLVESIVPSRIPRTTGMLPSPRISDIPAGSLRLRYGQTPNEGLLEVLVDGVWGTVCDDLWSGNQGVTNTITFCRLLGLPTSGAQYFTETTSPSNAAFRDPSSDSLPINLDEVACTGQESSVLACQNTRRSDCSHVEDVALRCIEYISTASSSPSPSPTGPRTTLPSGTLRLQDGPDSNSGRLEIVLNGVWSTICASGSLGSSTFDYLGAQVACRQLGLAWTEASPVARNTFPEGTSPIGLGDVRCIGSEQSLLDCPSGPPLSQCTHFDDVGIQCRGGGAIVPTSSAREAPIPSIFPTIGSESQLRLLAGVDGFSGLLQVFHSGAWGTVCKDNWDSNAQNAQTACYQLGLPASEASFTVASASNRFSGLIDSSVPIWIDQLQCSGVEPTLAQCRRDEYGAHDCTHAEDVILQCAGATLPSRSMPPPSPSPTTVLPSPSPSQACVAGPDDGRVRLVGSIDPSIGRVEINLCGVWGTVCGDLAFDSRAANVICRQAEIANILAVAVFPGSTGYVGPGVASQPIWLTNVNCTGSEEALLDCRHEPFQPFGVCSHATDITVRCIPALPTFTIPGPSPASEAPRATSSPLPSSSVAPSPTPTVATVYISWCFGCTPPETIYIAPYTLVVWSNIEDVEHNVREISANPRFNANLPDSRSSFQYFFIDLGRYEYEDGLYPFLRGAIEVTPDGQPISPCASSPCQRGGLCVSSSDRLSFTCNCTGTGYAGERCELLVNSCISSPCSFGTCSAPEPGRYVCTCVPGYTGVDCNLDVNECASSPCRNSGSCLDQQNMYTCQCRPGYTGTNCETKILYCPSSPCANGGTCSEQETSFLCICRTGFSGANCQQNINDCLNEACLNGGACTDGIDSFVCNCTGTGFTGTRCEISINECLSSPCVNGGACRDGVASFLCTCPIGFFGPTCESTEDFCSSSPCQNSGQCFSANSSCVCSRGWEGRFCQTESNECESQPCQNAGLCRDNSGSFSCTCRSGYTGRLCEIEVNECASSPCFGNATCVNNVDAYFCICPTGWQGALCNTDFDECASSPCRNGANCTDQASSFVCTCTSGFTGTLCDGSVNECESSPCANGGTCNDGVSSFSCRCREGFTGALCNSSVDECMSSPCLNSATCVDGTLSVVCICETGYTGSNCGTNVNDCEPNPCQNGGTCLDGINSVVCVCPSGYTGQRCAEQVDDCASSPCLNGATCEDRLNSVFCACPPGFEGDRCAVDINECISAPCQNNGTCTNQAGGFSCACRAGWTGRTCAQNVDECASVPCANGATCLDGLLSVVCVCPQGFTGPVCQTDLDECRSSPCLNGGECRQGAGNFRCLCQAGYTGVRCETDADSCRSSPCRNGGTCRSLISGFVCDCPATFSGFTCANDTNECESQPCYNDGTCIDSMDSFVCVCRRGFTGTLCNGTVDECLSSPCRNGGSCVDGVASVACTCAEGFTGALCEVNINDCTSTPCRNEGRCVDGVNSWSCACASGFTGTQCEIDVNECLSQPCVNNGTCQDLVNGFRCVCPTGFSGVLCAANINECASRPCVNGATCSDSIGSYVCVCPPGFSGALCEIALNECVSSPCQNSGICQDLTGRFQCSCLSGFTGSRCEVNIDECVSQPCRSGASCVDGRNMVTCLCPAGITGPLCQSEIDECASRPCQNGGVCTDALAGFSCVCSAGFSGSSCEINLQECTSSPCLHGATCVDRANSYTCTCVSGYAGARCETDVNECASNPCRNGGTCVDNVGRFQCTCPAGYTGSICLNTVNECESSPCARGVCVDFLLGFACNCPQGYSGRLCDVRGTLVNRTQVQVTSLDGNVVLDFLENSLDKATGVFIEEATAPLPPVPGAGLAGSVVYVIRFDSSTQVLRTFGVTLKLTQNAQQQGMNLYFASLAGGARYVVTAQESGTPGRRAISCSSGNVCGYVPSEGYVVAFSVNECSSSPCANGGVCSDSNLQYTCNCARTGFSGTNCDVPVNECASNPCRNQGTCTDGLASFTCACRPGYTGRICENNINECAALPCLRGLCRDGINSFACICPSGYTGNVCQTVIQDPSTNDGKIHILA
jgi:hypothetical protein